MIATSADSVPYDDIAIGTDKMVINLSTETDQMNDIKWTGVVTDNDNLLENGDEFEIVIDLANLGAGRSLTIPLGAKSQFNVQVKPVKGSLFITIQRALPRGLEVATDIH